MIFSSKSVTAIFGIGLSVLAPNFAAAQNATPFDGIYAPAKTFDNWSCKANDLGGDGGALGVSDGLLHGVENSCELTNPTNIRGMDAILYDAVCSGEGEEYSYRIMLMKHSDGIFLVQDNQVSNWRSCK